MPFFTQAPMDEYGNNGYFSKGRHNDVIEATIIDDGEGLQVTQPADWKWPSMRSWSFLEVPGPARLLTKKEWIELLQVHHPDAVKRIKPKTVQLFLSEIE